MCWKQPASECKSALSLYEKLQKPDDKSPRTDLPNILPHFPDAILGPHHASNEVRGTKNSFPVLKFGPIF